MPHPARFPFLKALESGPASVADFKQCLDSALSENERMAAELGRKDEEIRQLRDHLRQLLARLQELERTLGGAAEK